MNSANIIVNICRFYLLQAFIGHDITFAVKPYFRGPFCADDVREGLVVQFIRHILHTAEVRVLFVFSRSEGVISDEYVDEQADSQMDSQTVL